MSSETKFSTSHSSFWNALLPMGESYVRAQNARLNRFAKPFHSAVPAEQRGVINEGAFLIFREAMRRSQHPWSLPAPAVDMLLGQAVNYVESLRQSIRVAPGAVSHAGRHDAIAIAARLHTFFGDRAERMIIKPRFPGCGWVNEAEGDVLSRYTLYEVKAGERLFRLADIRQVLCYCALDFSSKTYGIKEVSVINPRMGTFIREDLDSLCRKISGTGSANVLSEIIGYISEPLSHYQTV